MTTWQSRLEGKPHPRVGLVWSGNPGHERDRERSIGLRTVVSLLDGVGADVTFVSLQKDVRAEDAALLKERVDILDYGNALEDFSDTAALISQLDLVISGSNTSVAHLAGALGKPVWILLTYFPDWRWLLGRDDSPWYPTVRLFRQDKSLYLGRRDRARPSGAVACDITVTGCLASARGLRSLASSVAGKS